jgi:hypothetical protein
VLAVSQASPCARSVVLCVRVVCVVVGSRATRCGGWKNREGGGARVLIGERCNAEEATATVSSSSQPHRVCSCVEEEGGGGFEALLLLCIYVFRPAALPVISVAS